MFICIHSILVMAKVYILRNTNFPLLLVHNWGAVCEFLIVYLRIFFFLFQVYVSSLGVFCFSTSTYFVDYCLIYFIFIRSGDDLGPFFIRYNLSSCGDYTSVFPRVFFGVIWGQSPQADKQKKMKECWNLWRIDWLIVPLDASNSNVQSY